MEKGNVFFEEQKVFLFNLYPKTEKEKIQVNA